MQDLRGPFHLIHGRGLSLVIHYCLRVLFLSRDTPTQRIIVDESSSGRLEGI
jgi:hypothetical protein